MKVLTVEECVEWLAARNLVFRPARAWGFDHQLELPYCHRIWFSTPSDAKRQLSLAHMLTGWFECTSSLLAINVVALFEPYELDALMLLRRCHGDDRWMDDVPGGGTPGHYFDDGPLENRRRVREFVGVMLAFTFQGYLVQNDGQDAIWIADEVIDVYSHDVGRIHLVKDIVDALGLQLIGRESPIRH